MPVSSLVLAASEKETGGSLKFPGNPLSHICPALRPRPDHRVRLLALWCCSRWHKGESSSNLSIFRGSITRLLYSLHTLEAAISVDSPMLASGRLPPFPGGLCGPTGFLQRISTSGYPIVSFLSGFILTLYAGFELELAGTERYRERFLRGRAYQNASVCPYKNRAARSKCL